MLNEALTSTKYDYPSIPVYHALGPKGRVTEAVLAEFEPGETILWTRKFDGSNTKILFQPGKDDFDFLVGTREGWLYAQGDRIHRKDHGILSVVLPKIWSIEEAAGRVARSSKLFSSDGSHLIAVYGEVFGGLNDVRHSARYGAQTRFVAFDVVVHAEGVSEWLMPSASLQVVHSEAFTPRTPEEMADMMGEVAGLTGAGTDSGYLEGYVLRSAERPWVKAKVRFESYWK